MATYTAQDIGYAGAAVTHGAVTVSDNAFPEDRLFLWVKNASGGSINVTISVGGATFGQNHADIVTAVPAGQERMFGPLLENLGGSDTFGLVLIAYSATTSVTAALCRLSMPPASLE